MAKYTIHNVRFYDFEPKAIQCMSYEEETSRLALSRADGSIEIWNCHHKPFMQQFLPGDDESSVEAVVWCRGRLFSAGLHGFILEHNLATGEVLSRTAVTGGPTWCLSLSPDKTKLAAGTEEGYLSLFNIFDKGILYDKTLEKQEGRILHLSWHCSGDYIVTGSVNCVRLWSLENEQMMRCSIAHKGDQEIIVWCVGILDDMTIVSGDSRGKTCFWNGKLGMITESIQTHKADVLSLVVSSDQKTIFVAGVDPVIVQVNNVVIHGNGEKMCWVKSHLRSFHTHDVRALALTTSDKMYSGGVDTVLTLSYYPPKTVVKFPAHPPHGSISVAGAASCVLLRHRELIELWRLGSHSPDPRTLPSSNFLHIDEDRVKLLEVRSRPGEVIDWCALSPKALWIAYIVSYNLKLLQFYPPKVNSKVSLRRVRGMSKEIQTSHQVVWLGEAKLASAATTGVIQVITVSEIEASVERELSLKPGCSVLQMTASSDGNTLVVVDNRNQVTALSVESGDGIHLPTYDSPVTAVGIHPTTQVVVVAYADMMMKEFSLSTRRYTNFSRQALSAPPPDLVKRSSIINNISFDIHNPALILLHNNDSIIILDKKKDVGNEGQGRPAKIKRAIHSSDTSNSSSSSKVETTGAFSCVQRSNQIIHFSYVRDESVLSVELNPLHLLDKLPPVLRVKKFGAG